MGINVVLTRSEKDSSTGTKCKHTLGQPRRLRAACCAHRPRSSTCQRANRQPTSETCPSSIQEQVRKRAGPKESKRLTWAGSQTAHDSYHGHLIRKRPRGPVHRSLYKKDVTVPTPLRNGPPRWRQRSSRHKDSVGLKFHFRKRTRLASIS